MLKFPKNKYLTLSAVVIVVAIGIGLYLKNAPQEAAAEWFDDNWHYRTKLTIDNTKIDSDLTDFPMAIHLNSTRINYGVTQANGEDIRVTDKQGVLLPYEIEKWDTSATSTIWVKVPEVHKDTDTELYLYYGNASVDDGQNVEDVWDDNYKMVQHLEEAVNTNADGYQDSSKNNNDGTGVSMALTEVAGRIGTAQDFDGSADYIDINTSIWDSFPSNNTSFTIEYWFKSDNLSGQHDHIVIGDPVAFQGGSFWTLTSGAAIYVQTYNNSTRVNSIYSTSVTTGTWYHVAFSFDGSTQRLYVDGVERDSDAGAWTSDRDFSSFGRQSDGEYFDGVIDDARVSDSMRSAAHIKASYNSGADSLLTYGAEEVGKGPIGYWSFDEGYGTVAHNMASATGTDGTLTNGPLWKDESMCVSGKCLEFDGSDDYVDMGDVLDMSTNDFTVTFWVNADTSLTTDDLGGRLVQKRGTGVAGTVAGWQIAVSRSSSNVQISNTIWDDGANNDFLIHPTSGDVGSFTIGQTATWIHVSSVFDNTNNRWIWYVNGKEEQNFSVSASLGSVDNNRNLTFGASDVSATQYFPGLIDEVKIFPYALSADEVKAEFNARGTVKGASATIGDRGTGLSDGLVGWWKMDESAANTCSGGVNDSCDSSGAGNDGAWNGGATATTTAKFGRAVEFDGTGDYVEVGDFDL